MAVVRKSVKKTPVKKTPVKSTPKKAAAKPAPKSAAKSTPKMSAAKKSAAKSAAKSATKKTVKGVATALRVAKKPPPSVKKATAATEKGQPQVKSLLGKNAPSFELQDQSGAVVSSASLSGKPYVLYFYPKDNTPGCTVESCEFRDEQRNFRASGVTIFGVSPDSVKSHVGFAAKFELSFPLLSDPDKVLAQAYGVWALKKNYGREYWGIVRSTFLIDRAGKVAAEWRQVKVKGHARAVLGKVTN